MSSWATVSRWCCRAATTTRLTTVPNQFNASQLEISTYGAERQLDQQLDHLRRSRRSAGGAHPGDRSGAQSIGPDRHGGEPERQHAARLRARFERAARRELFSVGAPHGHGLGRTTPTPPRRASRIANIGALTSDNYVLAYNGGRLHADRCDHGRAQVPLTGAGTAASPLTGGRPVDRAVGNAGGGRSVPDSADGAGRRDHQRRAHQSVGTRGGGRDRRRPPPTPIPATPPSAPARCSTPRTRICYATTTINSSARPPIRSTAPAASPIRRGANITLNGWQAQISGTPATGDVFTVQSNAGGTGDNTNALAGANQQTPGHPSNGDGEHLRAR